jgi:hypothetical protein
MIELRSQSHRDSIDRPANAVKNRRTACSIAFPDRQPDIPCHTVDGPRSGT